jgi:hypothetical protein
MIKKRADMISYRIVILLLAVILLQCGDKSTDSEGDLTDTPGAFGDTTSAVIVVNPVINQGSSTTIESGSARSGIEIKVDGLPPVTTDSTGLAVVTGLPVAAAVPIIIGNDTVFFQVFQEHELYDVVVAYRDTVLQTIFPPVRYPIGGDIVILNPGDNISSFISDDSTIVLLKEGIYSGGFEIRAVGVLILGAWSPTEGPLSVIKDSIRVLGEHTRFRGVKIEGKITVRANYFEAAFCEFGSADILGDGIMLLRNTFTQGQAIVPSSSAILVDNINIP